MQYSQALRIYVAVVQTAGGLSTGIKILLGKLRLNAPIQKESTNWSQIHYRCLSPAGCGVDLGSTKAEEIRPGRQSSECILADISMIFI